jgi:transposase
MSSHLSPKNLARVMREVGVNRVGQNVIFNELADLSKQLVYDLSSVFSRAMNISQAEKGYNKDKIHVPQINLALLCSADSGLPTIIRSLPGSVKDIKTLYHSINELDLGGKILVLDRGFFSEDAVEFLDGKNIVYTPNKAK